MHREELETTLASRLAIPMLIVGAFLLPVFLIAEVGMRVWRLVRTARASAPNMRLAAHKNVMLPAE